MTLIKSISGIRGTIGGEPEKNLTPLDVTKYAAAFGTFIKNRKAGNTIIIGRDSRPSGPMIASIVAQTLASLGLNVIDLGQATTPTVEMAVTFHKAAGGIIITASHNPRNWNALKLLNEKGEFISELDGAELLKIADKGQYNFASVEELGTISTDEHCLQKHIDAILALPLVDKKAIAEKGYVVAVDAVNSIGGVAVPALLKALGIKNIVEINCVPDGKFAHNPEPLPENLTNTAQLVKSEKAHIGFVVDPDVDRLAIICEDGEMFGEEYTLVAVADYILKNTPGNTVSNLSSTRALREITEKTGNTYFASAVGEVNVVEKMKEFNAVIGGEGNGGIIYPELHYGRDALVGIALFLTHMAKSGQSCSALRRTYPSYIISKNKVELPEGADVNKVLAIVQEKYKKQPVNSIDGVRIEFDEDWVHLRKSNTEPIIRIYAESSSEVTARNLAKKIIKDIGEAVS